MNPQPDIPQEIVEKIKIATEKESIYEPKYGGKDHSGYHTMMLYEVNYEREECFQKGAEFGYSLAQQEIERLKEQIIRLEMYLREYDKDYAKRHNIG